MEETNENANQRVPYGLKPSLAFYHQNLKGNGCALKLELTPAGGSAPGYVYATFASQATLMGKDFTGRPSSATFDWKNSITVKLDIGDLTEMIMVFRGIKESIEDGRGLYHQSGKGVTIIRLEHAIDPVPGYVFGVSRKPPESDNVVRHMIMLSISEAMSLSLALESMLGIIAFGIPREPPPAPPRDRGGFAGYGARGTASAMSR